MLRLIAAHAASATVWSSRELSLRQKLQLLCFASLPQPPELRRLVCVHLNSFGQSVPCAEMTDLDRKIAFFRLRGSAPHPAGAGRPRPLKRLFQHRPVGPAHGRSLRTRGADRKQLGPRRHATGRAGSDVKQLGELAVREISHARLELALALLRVEPS